jgi:Tfp pilus assembly protein PilX
MTKLIIAIIVVIGLITVGSFHVGYLTARIHYEKIISEMK